MIDELDDYLFEVEDESYYEVWAISYDSNNLSLDKDYLLCFLNDPNMAVSFADSITVDEIKKVIGDNIDFIDHFSIEVETVASVDGIQMNLGTIYKRNLLNKIIADITLTRNNYELLEDGSLMVSKHIFSNVNTKETIKALFEEETSKAILPLKITGDCYTDKYVCEIVFD